MNEIDNGRVSSDTTNTIIPVTLVLPQLNMIMNEMTRNMNDERYEFSCFFNFFCHFLLVRYRPTDRPIDTQMDRASYRGSMAHLKNAFPQTAENKNKAGYTAIQSRTVGQEQ